MNMENDTVLTEERKHRPREFRLRLNSRMIIIILIFAFAFVTRLYNIQEKAIMHDESMFTYYSLFLAQNGNYVYRPILHGPLLEEMTALMFQVFGDTTYTMRLFPAICGILIMFVILGFRSRLGKNGLIAALALVALSPFLMFYARFCRNDMPFALFSILTFYLYWKFFREGKGLTLVFAIISSMMLICIKENQLIYFFTVYTFAGLLFLVDFFKQGWNSWKKRKERKPRPSRSLKPGPFSLRPLCLLSLIAGIGFYVMGHFANYADLKGLGFLGVVAYLVISFWFYFRDVREEDPKKAEIQLSSYWAIGINSLALTFFMWMLYVDLFSGLGEFAFKAHRVLLIFIFWYALLLVFDLGIRKNWGEDNLLRRFFLYFGENYWYFLIGIFVSSILYIILFTTWFRNPESPLSLYKKTFAYWAGQHKEHRIKGEFHFYLPLMAIYNIPALLIIIGGSIALLWKNKWMRWIVFPAYILIWLALGAQLASLSEETWKLIDDKIHMTSWVHFFLFISIGFFGTILTIQFLWKKERFNAFLVYWSMGSFLGYSYAGEKVPWVTVHIMLPVLLLCAVYIKKLWKTGFFKRTAVAWYVIFILFAAWNFRNAIMVSFVNHSNIAERMIYSHAPMDVPKLADEIEHISFQLGTEDKARILVKGWAVWPMRWYLRDMDWTEWEKPETTEFPMVILDYDKATSIKNITDNYHISKYTVIQWWVPEMLSFKKLFNIWKGIIPKQYAGQYNVGEDVKKSKEEWKKIWDYMIHRKTYECDDPWPSVSTQKIAFCVRKNILER